MADRFSIREVYGPDNPEGPGTYFGVYDSEDHKIYPFISKAQAESLLHRTQEDPNEIYHYVPFREVLFVD